MPGWRSLGAPSAELRLEFTLPTGQSFRWRQTGEGEYTGVVDRRVVRVQQLEDDVVYQVIARGEGAHPADDEAVLRDYFSLDASLAALSEEWAQQDARFRNIRAYFPGARVLRQDPVECLFQFICSSNNHILRIHGMLSKATEADLRADGFGYRAKFITGSVAALLEKPGGGSTWLKGLRTVPYAEASEALCTLMGIGPKVAACICLFALDKTEAIPVDTHVWQLAIRYYTPNLKGKSLTKKDHLTGLSANMEDDPAAMVIVVLVAVFTGTVLGLPVLRRCFRATLGSAAAAITSPPGQGAVLQASWWCMEELRIATKESRDKIRPVFFGVKPGAINDEALTASLAKMKAAQSTPATLLHDWKESLAGLQTGIGSVTGWEHKPTEQSLAELVSAVTGDILEALASNHCHQDGLVGMEARAQQLLDDHYTQQGMMLGLTGMGGIGKTTLATALYNRLLPDYRTASCLLLDVRSAATEPGGLLKMQQRILKELCGWRDAPLPADVLQGRDLLHNHLGNRKVLLVMDDVSAEGPDALTALLIKDKLPAGSCIIITSRDGDLLKRAGCQPAVAVDLLSTEQSTQLFNMHAFPDGLVAPDLQKLVHQVVEACGCLPMTLKVLGCYVKGMTSTVWPETVKQLKAAQDLPGSDDDKVFRRLRISYDGLGWQQQQMFLDVACLLLGRSAAAAKRAWAGSSWPSEAGLSLLLTRCLLTMDECGNLAMHDQLRDMGRAIEACGPGMQQDLPLTDRKRLWLSNSEQMRLSRMAGGALPNLAGLHAAAYCSHLGVLDLRASNLESLPDELPPSLQELDLAA
ncbi:hypothetical protein WJX72_005824 [[Myrmecia] bisecta]|uniref:DNA-(apurinic or apyrimidinic site) lyase n=1 Tax=[Myrmecia] bisecta TaxID=41462 RepID=A0AAW1PUC4_9CHLO